MKVLHVITESNLGGAQRNTLLSIRGLASRGCEVHLACGPYGPGDATALIREAEASGIKVWTIRSLVRRIDPRHDAAAALALARLLRREKYDVVHTHSTKAGMLGRAAAWLCRVPVIIHTFHGVPFDTRRDNWKTRLCFISERFFCLFCHKLVSVGEVLRGELIAHRVAKPGKIETIRSGVDFATLDAPADRAAVRRELGLPERARVIGFVGRLAEQKAPDVLLDAFALVRKALPDAHLVLVGEGPLHDQLAAAAARLHLSGCVHLLGERADVPRVMAALDLFALPSRWEGVGRALTEAMYMKLPVVSTGVNGVPELVQDEVTGLIIKGDDPADAAEKIVRLLTDTELARALGLAAHDRVKSLMSSETMVEAIMNLYRKLAHQDAVEPEASQGGKHVWDMRQAKP